MRARAAVALFAVLAIAALARFASWPKIFTADGVLLAADGDTYYHTLRAERIARDWPHVPWTDPGMNYPYGAEIPWPPLLDQIVGTISRATGRITPDHVAAVAATVPPFAGILVVAVTAALGGLLLGGGAWWDAALIVALLPETVRQSFVGRPDHHVTEVLFSALAYLAYVAGSRRDRTGWLWPAVLGGALALSFWNWSGSALYLLLLSAHVAVLHLVAPAGDPAPQRAARLLGRGALLCAALLLVSIALWGPESALRSSQLTPITGLSATVSLLTALSAMIVAAVRHRAPSAGPALRAASLALAALVPGALILAVPSYLRTGVTHGLTALGASSAWYASIAEFWPLVFSGREPWTTEMLLAVMAFGLVPLLLPAAGWLFFQAWRKHPDRRPSLSFLAVWCTTVVVLALIRRRFGAYALVPLAIFGAWTIRELAAALGRRFADRKWVPRAARLVALFAAVSPGLPMIAFGSVLPAGAADMFPILGWLRHVPAAPGREAVLSSWSQGHEIQWIARKPVVSTPFGTDIDVRSLQDEAAFFLTADPGAAEALLRRRRIGFLLLENPVREVATLPAFAPGSPVWAIEERGFSTGSRYAFYPQFFDLIVSRLYFLDGAPQGEDRSGLGAYRLLAESSTTVDVLGYKAQQFKLFGVVAGATIVTRGVPPGARVFATVPVETNLGRSFTWSTQAVVDPLGNAAIRVPYATGRNGMVLAGSYRIGDGSRTRIVSVPESNVLRGEMLTVDLAP